MQKSKKNNIKNSSKANADVNVAAITEAFDLNKQTAID